MPKPLAPLPTLASIAAQSARAQSLLDRWLTDLESAPSAPECFATNIHSLNQATGLLYRLTAIEKTLAALRYHDQGDLRMLQEMNFLLDKIQRLYLNRPFPTPKQSQRATPLPETPYSPPSTPRPPAAASDHPFGPQATCLDFTIEPPAEIADAIATNPSPAPQTAQHAPKPAPLTRASLLNTIQACRIQSNWRDESLRPQLLLYFCNVLNHFCDRMGERMANRQPPSPEPDPPSQTTHSITSSAPIHIPVILSPTQPPTESPP